MRQRRRIVVGAVVSTTWMCSLMLPPYLISRAIDEGLQRHDSGALARWVALLVGVGIVNAWLGRIRHRTMTMIRMETAFETTRAVVARAAVLGATLGRRVSVGEVVTIGAGDVGEIGQALTVTGLGLGSVIAYVGVAVLLLSVSPVLAAVVLLGVPVLALIIGPLLGRLQKAESVYRGQQGELTARVGDLVKGLQILNGIGGKQLFADRYRRHSAELRQEGYRVGAVTSWVQALGAGLPALFLALVTWLAARMAATGSITVGQLVAVYGYVAVLAGPVSFLIEGGYGLSRGLVAAARVVRILTIEPEQADGPHPAELPDASATLSDPASGVVVSPGRLTALAGSRPRDLVAVVDRLGRFADGAVTWGPTRLRDAALTEVRHRIMVADNDAEIFAGTLREVVSGAGSPDDDRITRALHQAVADDILLGLPQGLDSGIRSQGANLSGGQRQRLRLARSLLADPEVLLLVEPTSAVDAHTEAAIAARLRAARSGRTTVVVTTSPLLLEQADVVYHLVDGQVAAVGSHRELLDGPGGYRALVSREDGGEVFGTDGGVHAADGVRAEAAR
ncbi:ABC transporter ATP-binding protein/permease [Kitasatospora sp. NBC_01250]|uniref:ABC transporter ATP-binding protein n=1 Tax=Kitasatospora sp. NBC_01250 TaxID=2903571 RepID=UPI002E368F65|nr:ABC transporter ATP-binding protein [Kitasatospora sp. NBC_01250]